MDHERSIDLSLAADHILGLVRTNPSADAFLRSVIDWCENHRAHPTWAALRGLDIEGELLRCRVWFRELLNAEPPSSEITGFYFGVFDVSEDDVVRTELYAAGGHHGENEWVCRVHRGWWPEGRYANSRYLAAVYAIAHAEGGLGNDADYPIGLAFSLIVARELSVLLVQQSGVRWVAAGFDEGDIIELGSVGPEGLKLTLVGV